MPKMKTHSGTKKRFKVTGTGKLRARAGQPPPPARGQVVAPHAPAARRRGRHARRRRSESGACSASERSTPVRPVLELIKEHSRGTREAGSQRP